MEAFDKYADQVWSCEMETYGKVKSFTGEEGFIPFRFQGQYHDVETGLYYNRFRYYAPEEGMYVSQDPIGLAGGDRFYTYVHDTNSWLDVFGLRKCTFSKNFDDKLKKHANDIYQTARKLGIEIPKGDNTDLNGEGCFWLYSGKENLNENFIFEKTFNPNSGFTQTARIVLGNSFFYILTLPDVLEDNDFCKKNYDHLISILTQL